jgi:hypothetical protein
MWRGVLAALGYLWIEALVLAQSQTIACLDLARGASGRL